MKIPEEVRTFIKNNYSDVNISILAGSFVRGEATKTSDFDIVIINQKISHSYRETFSLNNRIYEVFIHSYDSCLQWFEKDLIRRKPSLQNMIKEGLLISGDNDMFTELKSIATKQVENGPSSFSKEELEDLRYLITDILDDLLGSESHDEWIFIVNDLIFPVLKLDIIMNGHWLANGKRLPRYYKNINNDMYDKLITSLNSLYLDKSKNEFIDWVFDILNQYGGRLDHGYCRGKKET